MIAVAAAVSVLSAPTPQPLGIGGDWRLVLNSEFNGSKLPAGWRQGWYANRVSSPVNKLENDCYSSRNVTFPGDGTIHLNVSLTPSFCGGRRRPYTGALVSTNPYSERGRGFQYTYGVMQARVYLPANGSELADWPAVWAVVQPSRDYGEDDVIEGLGGQGCWHFHRQIGVTGGCATTLTPGWHTVASYWRKGAVTFYYDGKPVGEITTGITSRPMYLILDNTAMIGEPTVADSMRVQYVRVWQQAS